MLTQRTGIDYVDYCITFLARTLPPRSVKTFLELLFGAMFSSAGFVTEAYLAINPARHWTAYYKWLQQGLWSWLKLGRQLLTLLWSLFPDEWKMLVIDDSLIFRLSQKAPASRIHYDHSHKGNRPAYVRGQCWVCLGAIIGPLKYRVGIPVLARLSHGVGQPDKLRIAQQLIRAVARLLPSDSCLLLDSWYMTSRVIQYANRWGWTVIGQVRKDLALFAQPQPHWGRGRPRHYGKRIQPHSLEWQRFKGHLYGRHQPIHYCHTQAKARFLNGRWVRAVWCYFQSKNGTLTRPRLLISTNPDTHPVDVILAYARRFYIEPVFDDVKNRWGWRETWQQNRVTLHRWVHLLFASYAIPKLLTLSSPATVQSLMASIPWRNQSRSTAGQIRLGLIQIFRPFRIRDGWDPKTRKFQWAQFVYQNTNSPPQQKAA